MEKTFLFYDIETTGLHCAFDQVMQFAAIRTDIELNEISRHEIFVKMRPDVIPSPYAIITHRISPFAVCSGKNEYEAIREIHALFNTPGTISLGYNTLSFDDEFLRFAFFRNLLPPYTHQYANSCSRMDLYPIAVLFYLFGNTKIQWPEIDGRVSMRLEHLSQANHLAEGQAHNAMVDVLATVELAKLFSQYEDQWKYAATLFDKNSDLMQIKQLYPWPDQSLNLPAALYIEGKMGYAAHFQCPTLVLGTHTQYRNQHLLLRLDLAELAHSTIDNFHDNTWVIRKKLGEPGFILPIHPRFLKHLSQEKQDIVAQNLAWLNENPRLLEKIINHYANFQFPLVSSADVDSQLYQMGFLSQAEQAFCQHFHGASPTEKHALLDQFHSAETQELALRLLGRNYPECLPSSYHSDFLAYLDKVKNSTIIDYKNKMRYTLKDANNDINKLLQEITDPEQLLLLNDTKRYLEAQFS